MPEAGSEMERDRGSGALNRAQQRRLSVTCKYIDNLLCEIEHAINTAASRSPFPRYVVDVTPAQILLVEDHIALLRAQLLRTLDWQHLKPEQTGITVMRSALTDLAFVDIAIEELKPRYLRGCGAVPEDAVEELNGVIQKLRSLTGSMERCIRQEMSKNLESRARDESTENPQQHG